MKKLLSIVIVVVLLAGQLACASKLLGGDKSNGYEFTDSSGRTVVLPDTINKVAPSGAVAQMILFSIAPDKLVGLANSPSEGQLKYMPEEYKSLPLFGQFYGSKANLNTEALMAAEPELIIDLGDLKEGHAEDMDAVQQKTGIPTIFIETSLDKIAEAYRILGRILGVEERGNSLADYIEETINDAKTISATIPEGEKVSVMYGSGESGLNCNARGSIQADVIELVGAVNAVVVDEVSNKGGGNTINHEQLMLYDPDVILVTPEGPYSEMASDPQWQVLRAVDNGNYFVIPMEPYNWLSSPPSVNRILGIRWLGCLVYPEYYSYDMVAEAQRFYSLFWGYELSADAAIELLANSTQKGLSEIG